VRVRGRHVIFNAVIFDALEGLVVDAKPPWRDERDAKRR
jgi:hypothetical protein